MEQSKKHAMLTPEPVVPSDSPVPPEHAAVGTREMLSSPMADVAASPAADDESLRLALAMQQAECAGQLEAMQPPDFGDVDDETRQSLELAWRCAACA